MSKPGYRKDLATQPTNSAVSVGTSNTPIVPANTVRNCLILVNDGVNVVYLSFGTAAAVASSGIRLNALGGMIIIDNASLLPHGVNGIAVGGSSAVTICEY